jgi:hypothetical protein
MDKLTKHSRELRAKFLADPYRPRALYLETAEKCI